MAARSAVAGMSQQASVGQPRGPRGSLLPFDGIRPPPSEGLRAVKSPSFTARFFHLIEQAGPTGQSKLLIFRVLRD